MKEKDSKMSFWGNEHERICSDVIKVQYFFFIEDPSFSLERQ